MVFVVYSSFHDDNDHNFTIRKYLAYSRCRVRLFVYPELKKLELEYQEKELEYQQEELDYHIGELEYQMRVGIRELEYQQEKLEERRKTVSRNRKTKTAI